MDSLFGTSERKSDIDSGWDGRSIRVSYDRYPSLSGLLLKLLKTKIPGLEDSHLSLSTGAVESVFPALDIIRRAGPPSSHKEEIYNCVVVHLGSSIWHVREIAARTICTMLLQPSWIDDLTKLLEGSLTSQNKLHGALLATKFVLERRLELDPSTATGGLSIYVFMNYY